MSELDDARTWTLELADAAATQSFGRALAGLLRAGDAYDPGGSAGGFGVYWDRPVEVPGGFVTPAPLAGSTCH